MPKISDNEEVIRIGVWLRRRREAVGMTREELAVQVGTTYETIRLYEEGQQVMKVDRFFKIIDALGASLSDYRGASAERGEEKTDHDEFLLMKSIRKLNACTHRKLIQQIRALIEFELSDRR